MSRCVHVVAFPWLVGPEFLSVPASRSEFVRQQLVRGSGALIATLSLETTGDPRSATSAAPQGCVGQGMGGTPMSPGVQPVPAENAPTASTTAQGIVTRMGQDLKGLGGAAIEPGPEGMRPASSGFGACAGASGACAAATPAGQACAARAGAAALHAPPSNTGVNKIGSGHGV